MLIDAYECDIEENRKLIKAKMRLMLIIKRPQWANTPLAFL